MADYQYKNTGDRLKQIRKELGLKQEDFAKSLNITRTNCSDMESGRSSVTSATAQVLSDVYNISLDWLYTGKGYIFYDDNIRTDVNLNVNPNVNLNDENADSAFEKALGDSLDKSLKRLKQEKSNVSAFVDVNVSPNVDADLNAHLNAALTPNLPENGRYNVILLEGVSALANPSGIPSQIQVMPDRLLWLPQLPLGRTYFAISVDGDSMQPFYQHSDTIVIAPAAGSEFREDRIYVCVLRDNTTIIKRLRWCRFGQYKGSIECVSENPRYSPIHIDPAEIHTLYEIWARLSIFPE